MSQPSYRPSTGLRTFRTVIVAVIAAVLALAAAHGFDAVSPARAAESTKPATWQYKCIGTPPDNIPFSGRLLKLNKSSTELGAKGWELAAANEAFWCFKRPGR